MTTLNTNATNQLNYINAGHLIGTINLLPSFANDINNFIDNGGSFSNGSSHQIKFYTEEGGFYLSYNPEHVNNFGITEPPTITIINLSTDNISALAEEVGHALSPNGQEPAKNFPSATAYANDRIWAEVDSITYAYECYKKVEAATGKSGNNNPYYSPLFDTDTYKGLLETNNREGLYKAAEKHPPSSGNALSYRDLYQYQFLVEMRPDIIEYLWGKEGLSGNIDPNYLHWFLLKNPELLDENYKNIKIENIFHDLLDYQKYLEAQKTLQEFKNKLQGGYLKLKSLFAPLLKWLGVDRDGEFNIYDPFLLDLNGDGVKTIGHDGFNKAIFDHNGNGLKTATGWVDPNDGILVRDLDGDAKITRGAEMFGDQTLLADSVSKAIHGLAALADLDSNKDGKISAEDEAFSELQVWVDANSDGVTDEGELKTLVELEIAEISLDCQEVDQQLGAGNRLTHTGTYTKTDGTTGKTGDVDFALDTLHTQFTDTIAMTDEQAERPNIAGSGNLRELNQAAALSESLAQVLDAYATLSSKEEQIAMLDSLLLEWAKTDENYGGFSMIAFSTFSNQGSGGRALTPSQVRNMSVLGLDVPKITKETIEKVNILDSFSGTKTSQVFVLNNEEIQKFLDTVEETYASLHAQVYQSLIFQTRLQVYLQNLDLVFTDDTFAFDYSQVKAKFEEVAIINPQKAFVDLAEFIVYGELANENDA
ncbi:MAG: hypothetical protein IJP87_04810, partial [Campylobacter sp.]|nr:hypothetical protein [Campylobacter sp.]